MKKLMMMAAGLCALAVTAQEPASTDPINDDCVWSWWSGAPEANLHKDFRGCALGLGSGFRSVRGAQISLCMNTTEHFKGGAQVSIGYNRADEPIEYSVARYRGDRNRFEVDLLIDTQPK